MSKKAKQKKKEELKRARERARARAEEKKRIEKTISEISFSEWRTSEKNCWNFIFTARRLFNEG